MCDFFLFFCLFFASRLVSDFYFIYLWVLRVWVIFRTPIFYRGRDFYSLGFARLRDGPMAWEEKAVVVVVVVVQL